MFGWAKPVPINPRAMRNPKKAMIAVALAGPAANLLMVIVWAGIFHIAQLMAGDASPGAVFLTKMAGIGVFFNVLLMVLKKIKIYPV